MNPFLVQDTIISLLFGGLTVTAVIFILLFLFRGMVIRGLQADLSAALSRVGRLEQAFRGHGVRIDDVRAKFDAESA
jgi:hypothetical protein